MSDLQKFHSFGRLCWQLQWSWDGWIEEDANGYRIHKFFEVGRLTAENLVSYRFVFMDVYLYVAWMRL